MENWKDRAADPRRVPKRRAWRQELLAEGATLDAMEVEELEHLLEVQAEALRRAKALRRSASWIRRR
ncbi:MAG TPA: hypothetical protein VK501_05400 [Baekduia sp.]|uniref:hypothetical protein n=1 Tax=Baekduia sp. TaxID=2600305 RepID=UPI002BFEDC9B|nr:hypothetical protein [Baekduia sp.]HMJ33334.1 hypothetical protein [Baekduia sp.]